MTPRDVRPLSGRHVLIVEDQYLIAEDTRRLVEGMGAVVVGPAANLATALRCLAGRVDLALLDVSLGDADGYPLAQELARREIPFIFVTGYEPGSIVGDFRHMPHVGKPVDAQALTACIRDLNLATDESGRR